MTTSDVHEIIIVTFRDALHQIMDEQHALNPPLAGAWQLHTNRSVPYRDRQGNYYVSDLTLFYVPALRPTPILHLEVAVSQQLSVLLLKVDRMLLDPNAWGVLVIDIDEKESWSKPKKSVRDRDFVSVDAFDEETRCAQAADKYAALRVKGLEWMGGITSKVYFFPSDWELRHGTPQAVSHTFTSNHYCAEILLSIHWAGTTRHL